MPATVLSHCTALCQNRNQQAVLYLSPLPGVVVYFTKPVLPEIEAAGQLTAPQPLHSSLQDLPLVHVTLPAPSLLLVTHTPLFTPMLLLSALLLLYKLPHK